MQGPRGSCATHRRVRAHTRAEHSPRGFSYVPDTIVDRYRLYIVLKPSPKTIVTGTFGIDGLYDMKDMLAAVRGGQKELARKPMAIFDLCPSAPLKWGEFIAQNLLDCAKDGIPGRDPADAAAWCNWTCNARWLLGPVERRIPERPRYVTTR